MGKHPDWTYWLSMADVSVTDAVLLSCNLEPRTIERDERYLRSSYRDLFVRIDERLAIARSYVRAGRLSKCHSMGSRIDLGAFRAWAELLQTPFSFPANFPKAQAPADQAIVAIRALYPYELEAAVSAFEGVRENAALTAKRSPKSALLEWLETNRPKLSESARERVATVANWSPKGGAPRTAA